MCYKIAVVLLSDMYTALGVDSLDVSYSNIVALNFLNRLCPFLDT